MVVRFIVTTHAGMAGARLSLSGAWGNMPFADAAAAQAEACRIAGGLAHIEHERARAMRAVDLEGVK